MSLNGSVEVRGSPAYQDNTTVIPAPTNGKQSRLVSKSIDSRAVSRRLQSELMSLMMSGDPGVSAFPEADNIFSWIGTIKGGKDTVYEGLVYKLSMHFPTDYPFKPPQVKYETPCYHPNVDQYGNICLDILQDKWSSAYDVRTILLSIQSLLGEPNNESPLNSHAAALWNSQEEFKKVVQKQYKDAVEANGLKKWEHCSWLAPWGRTSLEEVQELVKQSNRIVQYLCRPKRWDKIVVVDSCL